MPRKVSQDKCIGCGSCTGVCPTEAITLTDEGFAAVEPSACIDCGACEGACPVEAIEEE